MSDGKVVFDITGNLSGINSALNNATNAISRDTAKWTVLGQTAMNALTSAAKAGFNAVKDLALNAFEYNAQMQTYEVNFKTMLGSAEAAQVKMAELKQYAAKTPFAFGDLADATQTMLAFGMTSEESALALRHLGDISLGDANKLKSLTLAFSQVSSTGKLMGQDLLQMINAGFNPLKVIAEETGVAYADLKAVMSGEKTSEDFQLRMEAARREVEELGTSASEGAIMLAQIGKDGMISADLVAAAMRIATSEGGAFYKALENASQTAKGQISTIKDSWDMLAGKITGGVFDQLSTSVLPKAIEWLDELNAAFDEGGFTGLKTAAGRIFSEIGGMAFDLGASLVAKIYNGLTGDDATTEETKAYLSNMFASLSDAAKEAQASVSGFLNDVLIPLFTWLNENGAAAQGILFGIGAAMALMGTPVAGIAIMAGVIIANWTDIKTAVESAVTSVSAFFTQTIPASWNQFVEDVKKGWQDNVIKPIDNAARSVADFFGIKVPEDWSLTKTIGEAWDDLAQKIDGVIRKIAEFFGLETTLLIGTEDDSKASGVHQTSTDRNAGGAGNRFGESDPYAGRFASWSAESQEAARQYAQYYNEYERGNTERWEAMEGCLKKIAKDPNASADDFLSAFEQLASQFEEGMVELPVSWFEGAEEALQSQLDGMDFHTTVDATVIPHLSPLDRLTLGLPSGWTGLGHADGGIFNAARRFLSADGMHTFGESGTEAILPLDTLWRKMGLTFDQAFAANLDALQYSVMPQIPVASPSAGIDEDKLAETIAAAVREAVSGLSFEMDKRKVGKIVAKEVSHEIANDVNGRKWTA